MGKPTVHDIASEAGVSLATVDRVLNSRPGVREQTVERVQAAIARLGYVRDTYAANLARQKVYQFVFILPEETYQFVEILRQALVKTAQAQATHRIALDIRSVPASDPHAVARVLDSLSPDHIDGVALMVPETPPVRDAVARLHAAGMAIATLVSDLPNAPRDHFVGIDNRAAGRTAGILMGRFVGPVDGKVAVLVNTMQARDMIERRAGFDEILTREFPRLERLPSLEAHDDHVYAAKLVKECFDNFGPIVGIYSAGSGTRGVTQALEELGLAGKVTAIAHELTPHNSAALKAGVLDVLIAQNVGHLARSALRVLRAKTDGVAILEEQERIRIDILIRENMPELHSGE